MIYKSYLAYIILAFILLVDAISKPEYSFILACTALPFFITLKRSIEKKEIFIFWAPLLICLFISFIYGIFNNSFSILVKDLWYFLKPIVFLLMGYYLRPYIYFKTFSRIVFFVSVVAGVAYSIPILISGDFFSMSPDNLRDKYGQGSYFFIFGLILWKQARFNNLMKWVTLSLSSIILIALILSYSRIMFVFIVLFLFIHFFPNITKTKIIQACLLIIMFVTAIPIYDTSVSEGDRGTFVEKLAFSFSEIRPQIYLLDRDIHDRWRGYETFMAISKYQEGTTYEYIFGQGLGQIVPINFAKRSRTGDEPLYHLEWLHNGYMTILLKCGFLGLVTFLFAFYNLLNTKITRDRNEESAYSLVIFIIIISTFLLGGFFNKSDVFLLFVTLGFLFHPPKTSLQNQSLELKL